MTDQRTGISNRETPRDEAEERKEHPPERQGAPASDVAMDDARLTEVAEQQSAHKAGARSIAQKVARARYTDRSMPATRKKPGAFGKEPKDVA